MQHKICEKCKEKLHMSILGIKELNAIIPFLKILTDFNYNLPSLFFGFLLEPK